MASMTQTDNVVGNSVFSSGISMDTTESVTLIGAGAGKVQAIHTISLHAVGTITAFTLTVFKNDGSTVIAKIGGQIGGASTGPLGPYVWNFTKPIICFPGDNAKVNVIATGATADTVHCGVGYELWAA